jgi:hypothetical protein
MRDKVYVTKGVQDLCHKLVGLRLVSELNGNINYKFSITLIWIFHFFRMYILCFINFFLFFGSLHMHVLNA